MKRRHFPHLVACLLLAACATAPRAPDVASRNPDDIRADIARRLPPHLADRNGWANDLYVALSSQDVPQDAEHVCAVIAVTAQESTFQANPVVPNLGTIAHDEIVRRAGEHHVPAFAVNAALLLPSANGRSYRERIDAARTEKDLSDVFEELIGRVPLGKRLFDGYNPVRTGGPMQVDLRFSEAHQQGYPYAPQGSIRNEVFSRRGGLWFGSKHLFGYDAGYGAMPGSNAMLYRFADYNAGWYASRNAAFQNALAKASGIALQLDGDVLTPDAPMDAPGASERAARAMHARLDLSDAQIRRDLGKGESAEFVDTDVYKQVFALADAQSAAPLPRAILPGIRLESPKITRDLTTAWFANRVNERWKACLLGP